MTKTEHNNLAKLLSQVEPMGRELKLPTKKLLRMQSKVMTLKSYFDNLYFFQYPEKQNSPYYGGN